MKSIQNLILTFVSIFYSNVISEFIGCKLNILIYKIFYTELKIINKSKLKYDGLYFININIRLKNRISMSFIEKVIANKQAIIAIAGGLATGYL